MSRQNTPNRAVLLDTETTGLEPEQGHRIIEIGCVEMIERRLTGNNFHQYLQPDREIDKGAIEVHGITNEFLADKPRFEDVAEDFIAYICDAELIIHNAPFDVGFIDYELGRHKSNWDGLKNYCTITDTLTMARKKHPGQRNSLDALCKRYNIDNSHRVLHGALLDAEILADVYLQLTGGQALLSLEGAVENGQKNAQGIRRLALDRPQLVVHPTQAAELQLHLKRLQDIDKASDNNCLWSKFSYS